MDGYGVGNGKRKLTATTDPVTSGKFTGRLEDGNNCRNLIVVNGRWTVVLVELDKDVIR